MLLCFNECIRPFRIMFCAELFFIEQTLNLQYTNKQSPIKSSQRHLGYSTYKSNVELRKSASTVHIMRDTMKHAMKQD